MKLKPTLYSVEKKQTGGFNGGANARLIGKNHTVLFLQNVPNKRFESIMEPPTEKKTPFEFTNVKILSPAKKFTRDFLSETEAYARRKEVQEALKFDFSALPIKKFIDKTPTVINQELSKPQVKPVGGNSPFGDVALENIEREKRKMQLRGVFEDRRVFEERTAIRERQPTSGEKQAIATQGTSEGASGEKGKLKPKSMFFRPMD